MISFFPLLKFFLTNDIIHRNFKMENILLLNYFKFEITDFQQYLLLIKKLKLIL